jgi:hypothetical protein
VTSVRSDGRAGSIAYVHGIGFRPRVRERKSALPAQEDRTVNQTQESGADLLAVVASQSRSQRTSFHLLERLVEPFLRQMIYKRAMKFA